VLTVARHGQLLFNIERISDAKEGAGEEKIKDLS
jgi:hypothetical protein